MAQLESLGGQAFIIWGKIPQTQLEKNNKLYLTK